MAVEIVVPRMGLTMEEGTIVAWLKNEGEFVTAGEPLLEIETDKATVEIESPGEGLLGPILAEPGATLPIGAVVAYLTAEGETVAVESGGASVQDTSQLEGVARDLIPSPSDDLASEKQRAKASPAARHLAKKLRVNLEELAGTGPKGRVVAWNVEEAARAPHLQSTPVKASPVAQRMAQELGVDLTTVSGSGPGGRITRQDVEGVEQGIRQPIATQIHPVSRSHRIMAERMSLSFSTVPHFYLHAEVDARQLLSLRATLLPRLEARIGVRITLTDILVKLCGLALAEHPGVAAQWTDEGLLQLQHVNIGVAVDAAGGLVVPVIRDADTLGLAEIARRRAELVERARMGNLLPQDMEQGVFTITNLGVFRVDSFDAILNPPQAAILAVGRIKERAIVENGEVIPASMMNVSLSVDHRVIDGAAAARFLGDLVEMIEMPGLALA